MDTLTMVQLGAVAFGILAILGLFVSMWRDSLAVSGMTLLRGAIRVTAALVGLVIVWGGFILVIVVLAGLADLGAADWIKYVVHFVVGAVLALGSWLDTLPWFRIFVCALALWAAVSLHNIRVILEAMARNWH
jgi:hypothetical protein